MLPSLKRRYISLVSDVEKMLVEKYPYNDIKTRILSFVNQDETQFNLIYRLGLDRFSEGYTQSRGFYINQTINRYEEEVRRLLNQSYEGENAVGMKIYAYLMVLDTLKDLETLLGFRSPRIKIRVNNIVYKRTTRINSISNFSSLSTPEKQRLLFLLDKSKLSDLEQIKSVKKREVVLQEAEAEIGEDKYTQFVEINTSEPEQEPPILKREDVLYHGLQELQKKHIDERNNI